MSKKPSQTFACSYTNCGKAFRTQFSLNRHMILHNKTKNEICRFCGKRFALPQYLREHECIHNGEKLYVCGISGCDMEFRQAGKLFLHRKSHANYFPKKYNKVYSNTRLYSDYEPNTESIQQVKKPNKVFIVTLCENVVSRLDIKVKGKLEINKNDSKLGMKFIPLIDYLEKLQNSSLNELNERPFLPLPKNQ